MLLALLSQRITMLLALLAAALVSSAASDSHVLPQGREITDPSQPRFAYVTTDGAGLNLHVNGTSVSYGIIVGIAVICFIFLVIPLLDLIAHGEFRGGYWDGHGAPYGHIGHGYGFGGGYKDYGKHGYDDAEYYSYKRSLDTALPIMQHIERAARKFQSDG